MSENLWLGILSALALALIYWQGGKASRRLANSTRLLVSPKRGDVVVWAVKRDGMITQRGTTLYFPETIEELCESLEIPRRNVFVDVGYRTLEMRRMCARQGWSAVKGFRRQGSNVIEPAVAVEIEEATRGL